MNSAAIILGIIVILILIMWIFALSLDLTLVGLIHKITGIFSATGSN